MSPGPKTSPESLDLVYVFWVVFVFLFVFVFYICTGWVWSFICGRSEKLFPEVLLSPFIDLNYRIESVFNEVLPEGPESSAKHWFSMAFSFAYWGFSEFSKSFYQNIHKTKHNKSFGFLHWGTLFLKNLTIHLYIHYCQWITLLIIYFTKDYVLLLPSFFMFYLNQIKVSKYFSQ